LGDSFRFTTNAYLSGYQKNNVWHGNLYLFGTGDPLIGEDFPEGNKFFDSLVNILKQMGIDTLYGNIIADASYFGDEIIPKTYEYEDIGNYYGAGASSLMYNGNTWKIAYKLNQEYGKTAKLIYTEPVFPHVNYQNRVKVANRSYGNYTHVSGKPLEKNYIFSGTIPRGKGETLFVKASSPDPAYGFAWKTQNTLLINDIFLIGTLKASYTDTISYESKKLIFEYKSMPLDSIISFTLTHSYNVGAEILAKAIAKKLSDGSYESYGSLAKQLIYKFGSDTTDINICDGSGLSRKNKLTADAVLTLLIASYNSNWFHSLYNSLPVAGINGTLKKFLKGTPLENNLRAKSGYLRNTRAFAGYFDLPDGMDTIAFVTIVNNYNGDTQYATKNIEAILLNTYNDLTNKYRASKVDENL
jgi:D-alanyl-D-alanine carboxypeptidase/D-alanyl-D-alanine-endopeptidase (penicillin-binding protein 4)